MQVSDRIDIFRGYLCQYVIISHLIPELYPKLLGTPGTIAVWCFFVVSGYLNYASYQRSTSIKNYYWKRVSRLYPLLVFSYLVVAYLLDDLVVNDIYTIVPIAINVKGSMPHNSVLWTIIIELQLYICTPCFVALYNYLSKQLQITKNSDLLIVSISCAILSIMSSVFATKLLSGSVDLDDRMLISAIPFYVFGFCLYKSDYMLSTQTRKIITIASTSIFALIVMQRNGFLCNLTCTWDHLFIEGRLVALYMCALILLKRDTMNISNKSIIFRKIGQATFEIYVLHGLCAFILHQISAEVSTFTAILLSFWFIPTMVGLVVCNTSICKAYMTHIYQWMVFRNG